MPNLTSVERLARFYEDDSNYFVVLMVRYSIKETRALFSEVMFVPIEFLDWRCLTLGALGWGQIQIANSNRILLNPHYSHREWMLELCDILLEFYPKEIAKVAERIRHFENGTAYDQPAPERLDCHYLISAWSPTDVTPQLEPILDEHA
ncbi:MAG TPA: hypothetical protein PKE45_11455, partial [Caldilineaceae bacterium]|nr:hypothetical protein [Caldilineaceae bacterium]